MWLVYNFRMDERRRGPFLESRESFEKVGYSDYDLEEVVGGGFEFVSE
jgi:hypothetical protein